MSSRHSPVHASPVAEGVRIQIGSATAFAVRKDTKDVALRIRRERRPLRDSMERVPFVRGMVRLVGGVADFLDGVWESADLEPQQITRGRRGEQRFAELFRIRPASLVGFGSAAAAILLLVGLVLLAPWALERWTLAPADLPRAAVNAIACAARLLGGLICAALLPRLRVLNRFCMYRGALNKVLNTKPGPDGQIQRDRADKADWRARESDAAFVTATLLLSIVAFALVRTFTLPVQVLVRALTVLVIAGVLNEPVRALEALPDKHPAAWLLAPMQWLGRLFVREPHPQMVEVAVYAYNAARENDR